MEEFIITQKAKKLNEFFSAVFNEKHKFALLKIQYNKNETKNEIIKFSDWDISKGKKLILESEKGWNIYFTVNKLKEEAENRKQHNFLETQDLLYFDVDGYKKNKQKEVLDAILNAKIKPSWVVQTNGATKKEKQEKIDEDYVIPAYHIYYKLDKKYKFSHLKNIMKKFIEKYDLDKTYDISRVFRVPYTRKIKSLNINKPYKLYNTKQIKKFKKTKNGEWKNSPNAQRDYVEITRKTVNLEEFIDEFDLKLEETKSIKKTKKESTSVVKPLKNTNNSYDKSKEDFNYVIMLLKSDETFEKIRSKIQQARQNDEYNKEGMNKIKEWINGIKRGYKTSMLGKTELNGKLKLSGLILKKLNKEKKKIVWSKLKNSENKYYFIPKSNKTV